MSTSDRQTSSARKFASRLLSPGVLDEGLRSGVFFISGPDSDTSAFVEKYLAEELTAQGAIVVQFNLAGSTPLPLLYSVRRALHSTLDRPNRPPLSSDVLNTPLKMNCQPTPVTIARLNKRLDVSEDSSCGEIVKALVDVYKANVVLIINEIDAISQTVNGNFLLSELKAARDTINLALNSSTYFLFLGVGSSEAGMRRLTRDSGHAFFGANCLHVSNIDEW